MSHRGYGDPPYPPDQSETPPRAAQGRGNERRPNFDRNADGGGVSWDDARSSDMDDVRSRSSGVRRSETGDERSDNLSSRQSRSRWSNPPPRRRRTGSNGERSSVAAPVAGIAPRVDPSGALPRNQDPYGDRFPAQPPAQDRHNGIQNDDWSADVDIVPPSRRTSGLGGRLRPSRGSNDSARRRAAVPAERAPRRPRTGAAALHLPAVFTRAGILRDQVAMLLLGLAALSALLMAGVLAGRTGGLPDVVALRSDATGAATRWGTPTSLWELPLLAAMITLANFILAWWLSSYDRFASRFLLATAIVITFVAWVPLVRFLW